MAAAVQRIAIEAERQRFTLRHTRRTVPITFSIMLVQAASVAAPSAIRAACRISRYWGRRAHWCRFQATPRSGELAISPYDSGDDGDGRAPPPLGLHAPYQQFAESRLPLSMPRGGKWSRTPATLGRDDQFPHERNLIRRCERGCARRAVVDRSTISVQFLGRFDAHGLPISGKMPSIYRHFCTRPRRTRRSARPVGFAWSQHGSEKN
jgi:hypothetical protein